jgi:hypothetical protein
MKLSHESYLEDLAEKTVSYEERMAKKMVDLQRRRAALSQSLSTQPPPTDDYGDLGENAK